ncbi:uncharacterized protein V1518DRAFT_418888 [Limtongia smithiae]|uniref:uncharacterized protein n=1 Tax=Limtongia smithiae TaxID=1125753 RepID=UPI0034CECC7C
MRNFSKSAMHRRRRRRSPKSFSSLSSASYVLRATTKELQIQSTDHQLSVNLDDLSSRKRKRNSEEFHTTKRRAIEASSSVAAATIDRSSATSATHALSVFDDPKVTFIPFTDAIRNLDQCSTNAPLEDVKQELEMLLSMTDTIFVATPTQAQGRVQSKLERENRRGDLHERVTGYFTVHDRALIAIDQAMYLPVPADPKEIGVVTWDLPESTERDDIFPTNIIITENNDIARTLKVLDSCKSEILPLGDCGPALLEMLKEYEKRAVYVTQRPAMNLMSVNKLGVNSADASLLIDMTKIWRLHAREKQKGRLGIMMKSLDIPAQHLQNAANGARYIMPKPQSFYDMAKQPDLEKMDLDVIGVEEMEQDVIKIRTDEEEKIMSEVETEEDQKSKIRTMLMYAAEALLVKLANMAD